MARRMEEKLFRLMLRVFPRRFRHTYQDEMVELFLTRVERARVNGARSRLRLWTRTFVDLVASAAAVRARGSSSTIGDTQFGMSPYETHGNDEGDGAMNAWLLDLRHAFRRLAHSPLFTLAAISILAVGIGANSAAFSIVDAALFRPPSAYVGLSLSEPGRDVQSPSDESPFPISMIVPTLHPLAYDPGAVMIEARVDRTGAVTEATVKSSWPPFDGAALDAARLWTFRPPRAGAATATSRAYLIFGFRRQDATDAPQR